MGVCYSPSTKLDARLSKTNKIIIIVCTECPQKPAKVDGKAVAMLCNG